MFPAISFHAGMDSEIEKLRCDLHRYRFLLGANSDRQADQVIRELIAEAEARLCALQAGTSPTASPPSAVLPLRIDRKGTGFSR
jgi:hypothetical protein